MAKKVNKKVSPTKPKRTSSMEKCLIDAEQFLNNHKQKKILKTKTMARTIEEGKNMLAKKKTPKKAQINHTKPKRTGRSTRPTRPAIRALPAPPMAVPPATTAPTIIRVRSIDRPIKPTKATIFKTGSKDNLPLPAFGFIDICFCVDSTGSMGS